MTEEERGLSARYPWGKGTRGAPRKDKARCPLTGTVSRARLGAGRLDQQLMREMHWALIWGGMLMVMAPL